MSNINATGTQIIYASHTVNRAAIDVGQPFVEFRRRYEAAAPALDPEAIAAFVKRQASWDEIVSSADAIARLGFFIYWKMDAMPLMRIAGHTGECVEYLMGNHTIAERMFRYEQSVMLYAPLRTLLYVDAQGVTRFVIDQPSALLSSFANPAIAEVGAELDRKVVTLLKALDVPAAERLFSSIPTFEDASRS
jgi:hypothetical protein